MLQPRHKRLLARLRQFVNVFATGDEGAAKALKAPVSSSVAAGGSGASSASVLQRNVSDSGEPRPTDEVRATLSELKAALCGYHRDMLPSLVLALLDEAEGLGGSGSGAAESKMVDEVSEGGGSRCNHK